MRGFFAAFDRGDSRAASGFFAEPPGFQWYAVGPLGEVGSRLGDEAMGPETIAAYVETRHAQGERIEIEQFKYNGYDADHSVANFEIKIRRDADDLAEPRQKRGKGAVECTKGKIIALGY